MQFICPRVYFLSCLRGMRGKSKCKKVFSSCLSSIRTLLSHACQCAPSLLRSHGQRRSGRFVCHRFRNEIVFIYKLHSEKVRGVISVQRLSSASKQQTSLCDARVGARKNIISCGQARVTTGRFAGATSNEPARLQHTHTHSVHMHADGSC